MKYLTALFLAFLSFSAFSQEIAMADEMRASGKIYVVVGVLLIILLGLLLYLVSLDRKIKRLEEKIEKD